MFSMARGSGMAVLLALLLAMSAGSLHAQVAAAEANANQSAVQQHVKELIGKLNAADTIDREDAEKSLLEIGQPAVALLKDATSAKEPEISARAKKLVAMLVQNEGKPVASYSELFPASSVFFAESPNSKQALDRLAPSPLGRFWELPQTQKYFKAHYDAQTDNDKKVLDAIQEIVKLTDGKSLLAFGAPETAEATEIDPPMVYALESKQAHGLELQIRALLQAMNDPPKSIRRFGPFSIEEQISAQTVFTAEGMIHSLTQMGIESVLEKYTQKPKEPLTAELAQVRGLMPTYDVLIHFKHSSLNLLADAGQMVDEDIIRNLNTAGFVEGSAFQAVLSPNGDGFEEHGQIVVGGDDKNDGLLGVLKTMNVSAPAANAPQALDLIPWQTAILFSFQGDVAKNSAALSKALRALDFVPDTADTLKGTPTPPTPKEHAPKNPLKLDAKKPDAKTNLPKDGPEKPNTLGGEALAAGGGPPAPAGDKKPDAAGENKPDEPKGSYPHIQRFEKLGVKLDQFLEQVDGPVQLGLFLNDIGEEAPETTPLTPLVAVMLKDPKIVEQSLDALSTGDKPRFGKEVLNGGVHYVEIDGGDNKPGFWLKSNYLAYSTERDLLDLASKALDHQQGTERMADRPSYKQELASKRIDPQALLTIFGDADQMLEMPYKLAVLDWKPDGTVTYPDYKTAVKPILLNKPVSIQFKTYKDGLQYSAQTPLSFLGMIEAFRRPLKEAGL